MFHDSELSFRAASRKDFLMVAGVAGLLILCAALMSPKPLWIIMAGIAGMVLSALFHHQSGLLLSPTNNALRINCNGNMLLEDEADEVIVGTLSGPQWCSRYLAVLRYKAGGRVGHLVVLKIKQCPEQFRQLSVWLRHNSHNEGRQKS